jgi:dihydrofolate synthase/folylpolyglutamate synthase
LTVPGDYPGDYEAAVAFLDRRVGYGIRPGLERIEHLLDLMGNPHRGYPIIHVAGTNGKTTVVRMVSDILGAHGLYVGAFVSPHLHRVEDRYLMGGAAFGPTHLARAVEDIAPFVVMQEEQLGESPTYFELTAAVGFGAFSVDAVDVAVVEVGLGGRWDATNVVRAAVSAITGISLDHMSYLGETEQEIATEKAAILKHGGVLVTGPLSAEARAPVTARVAETQSKWFSVPEAFRVESLDRDERGWVADIDGIYDRYENLALSLHGRHQVTHLATAVAICEAFFNRALDPDALREAAATVRSPGRLEVVSTEPTVLLDGAHNEEGFRGLGAALDEEFTEDGWTLVIGSRGGRDVGPFLAPLAGKVTRVIATAANDALAVPASDVAAAAGEHLGVEATVVEPVAEAVARALAETAAPHGVIVAGSLYVIGEARHALGVETRPSPVHRRFDAPVGE